MGLHDSFHDGQTQAGADDLPGLFIFHAEEFVEDPGQVFGGDPQAVIGDLNPQVPRIEDSG